MPEPGSPHESANDTKRSPANRPRHHAALVVGAGPTGLMLAGELALAGVDVAIVERRTSQALMGARAGGLHARTLEVLDQRGIAERFVAEGTRYPHVGFAGVSLDITDAPTRFNFLLGLWQLHIERLLAAWVRDLRVPIHYGHDVVDATQDAAGVQVRCANGARWSAGYVVACDGGRSVVRKRAGIALAGSEPGTSNLIAEAALREDPPAWGIRRDAVGIHSLSRSDDGHGVRILVTEPAPHATAEPTLHDLSASMRAAFGTDYGVHSPTWLSRFTDATRQAVSYRAGRILLAGDAAHVHPPDGGHGLQTGVQDAVNLGWKLAQVIHGVSSEALLDSYHAERHPVAARVLRNTMASVALRRGDERTEALRDTVADLLSTDGARQRLAAFMAGLDVRYDFGEGPALLGRRVPDLDLSTSNGPQRIFELLRSARPVLLDLGGGGDLAVTPWADRVVHVEARCDRDWVLPAIGRVERPHALLVRPDGYVAWVGDATGTGLAEALTRWCGQPRAGAGASDTGAGRRRGGASR